MLFGCDSVKLLFCWDSHQIFQFGFCRLFALFVFALLLILVVLFVLLLVVGFWWDPHREEGDLRISQLVYFLLLLQFVCFDVIRLFCCVGGIVVGRKVTSGSLNWCVFVVISIHLFWFVLISLFVCFDVTRLFFCCVGGILIGRKVTSKSPSWSRPRQG